MEVYDSTVVEAGIDWVTAREKRPVEARALVETGKALVSEQTLAGYKSKEWAWYGFSGKQAGEARWGTCDRGAVVIVSGPTAHRHVRGLRQQAEAITRLDLCATVRINPPSTRISHEHYLAAVAHYSQRDGYPKPSLWVGSEGGVTFYLGDRSSSFFSRCYNKEIESGDPAFQGCWRYEVECKSAVANIVGSQAAASPDLVGFAAGYVWGYYEQRGIRCRYEATDRYQAASTPHKAQADANSLGWLGRGVRPTVEALIKRGLVAEVYEALGLTL